MPRKRTIFLTIVILGVALDLWTKHVAFEALAEAGGRIVVIENFFHLYEMRNPGMAWSLFQGVDRRVWIVIRGILALVLFGVYWTRPRMSWWANVAFAFVIAGAIGNLYDNCFALRGEVRDFILLIFWGWRFPVFNIADAMITIGAPILLLYFADPKKPDGSKGCGVKALEVAIGALRLRNPVLVASGTFGSGIEAGTLVDLSRIGGVVTKSVTTQPREGNPPPRIVETSSGMLNSIGIQNPGLEGFLREVVPAMRELPTARIVNVAGESPEDFERLCAAFADVDGVDAVELNVSCPNVAKGLDFGIDAALLESLTARCRRVLAKPMIVKLTPNVTDVTIPARAAERGGADAISLVNTFVGLAIDWRKRTPLLGSASGTGGLSGPAIKPLALHAVRQAASVVRIPVIGIGGIRNADDVMEFVVAGATAVQVGTQNFVDPGATATIVDRLEEWAASGLVPSVSALRGTLTSPRACPG